MRLVKGVDENDEALGLVALRREDNRDVVDDDAVVAPRDRKIILRSQRLVAEVAESESRDIAARLRDVDCAAEDLQCGRCPGLVAGQRLERRGQRPARRLVGGHMEYLCSREFLHPEVRARAEMDDVHVGCDEVDRRQEERSIQTFAVQILRLDVRGRDDDDPAREQDFEEPSEDHRVGDISDGEFVEAQQRRMFGDALGDGLDRILAFHQSLLQGLPILEDRGMDLGHEGVEMHAALLRHIGLVEEEIHQHRLAAPDATPDIEPARRCIACTRPEQPAESGRLAGGRVAFDFLAKGVEEADDPKLCLVLLDMAVAHLGVVELTDRHGLTGFPLAVSLNRVFRGAAS